MSDPSRSVVRRALVSVTDKTGIVDLCRALVVRGVEILSTGGTARVLTEAGVPVVAVEAFTRSPEMLDGRVKTLHPRIHGGILARRDLASHLEELERHGLDTIDLVVVNLYDFARAAARAGASFDEVLEEIDIGGPTLLRAAAKNHAFVLPLVDSNDYAPILEALDRDGVVDGATRRRLAQKVYDHTARYDRRVANWLAETAGTDAGAGAAVSISRDFEKLRDLRYGENPHQSAAFYRDATQDLRGLAAAKILGGKELSYNNLLDGDSALGLVIDLCALEVDRIPAVYIKHNNPCGAALGESPAEALAIARSCDPVSAFGAVVAVGARIDESAARVLTESFVEVVIAPGYDDAALAVLREKKNLRVLALEDAREWRSVKSWDLRAVRGGVLAQTSDADDSVRAEVDNARVVTSALPTTEQRTSLALAWIVAKHVRSNAIVFAREGRVVAVGAGQMSRIDSVELCRLKAGASLAGAVAASDAFFPFRDGVDALAKAGATAIVQPGGSIRDDEVIRAADEHGLAMIFTGVRHFRH